MKKSDIPALLERLGFPFAYDHFAEGEGPDPPFLVYRYPNADNFAADGVAYFKQDILHIEVYTDKKDPALEKQIEAALDEGGIFYGKGETWIDSEKLSSPVIKCKKTPRKKCSFVAEVKGKR